MDEILTLNPILKQILMNRGYSSDEEIAEYISRTPKLTYDPFLMKGMEEAVDLIIDYAEKGKCIYVYGDYDSDGINSVALLTVFLKNLTDNVKYYIPLRFDEGYGLNMKAVKKLFDLGAELIITVDCGSVSYEEVEYIKELGMSVIVTDHHNIDKKSADCIMLNPKQKDDDYPFSYLCGCGVAFKLAQAVSHKKNLPKKLINSMLDITGIATIGDIVPLVDENRTLVKYGMDRIKRRERQGLEILLDKIKIDPMKIKSVNVAFGIVPHLNSSGRMAHAGIGVELLTGSNPAEMNSIADKLVELNCQRKDIQDKIVEDAVEFINDNLKDDMFILYDAKNSHEGITGIAAGKLKDKYYKPVIIVTDTLESGVMKGTGRSVPGVDLYSLLNKYDDLFIKFGGHAAACGFSMYKKDIDFLRKALNSDMAELIKKKPSLLTYTIIPDAELSADDITYELAEQVQLMEPFGAENERPVFLVTDILIKNVFSMGNKNQYRKFRCFSESGNMFDVVCFDQDIEDAYRIAEGDIIDIFAETDINTWNGRSSVQLMVKQVAAIR